MTKPGGHSHGSADNGINEARLDALLRLAHMADESEREILDYALEEGVRLTRSRFGYVAFVSEDESVLNMYAWSNAAMAICSDSNTQTVYPVAGTGLWGEAVRQRCAVVTNDYQAPNQHERGWPTGHIPLVRHLGVPIIDDGRIVLVVGVANKASDYDTGDIRQLTLMFKVAWRHLRHHRAQLHGYDRVKAELIGRMVAHVAHDLNNIFAIISGALSLHERRHGPMSNLGSIAVACDRGAAITRQLLQLGRQTDVQLRQQGINVATTAVFELAKNLVGHRVRFCLELDAREYPVALNGSLFESALLNVVANARDAVQPDGIITIATALKTVPTTDHERSEGLRPVCWIAVCVRDDGCGMDAATQAQLFRPFFTTKPAGKGTGLGLCAVRDIMRFHGGEVRVDSSPGSGTTITLLFPQVQSATHSICETRPATSTAY